MLEFGKQDIYQIEKRKLSSGEQESPQTMTYLFTIWELVLPKTNKQIPI